MFAQQCEGMRLTMFEKLKSALRKRPQLFRAARAVWVWPGATCRRFARLTGPSAQALTHPWFLRDLSRYREMGGTAKLSDLHPMLHEKTEETPLDPSYFYQAVWAAKRIHSAAPERHVDVGSDAEFVGILTAFAPVDFIDIRPLPVTLDNLTNMAGTVLDLPFEDRSVVSLSCMHVIEHIGLGRYGDPLDPLGTSKAAAELQRVLATGGNLYVSVPTGAPRTEFNAHRVLSTEEILEAFADLSLVSFSIMDDDCVFHDNVPPAGWDAERYACGMFHFTRLV